MDMQRTSLNVLSWVTIAVAGAAFVGATHEMGHFVWGVVFQWRPTLSFSNGGHVDYANAPATVPSWQQFLALSGGPLVTFLMALILMGPLKSHPSSKVIFILALWNAVYRLNVLVDGNGADEAKMSTIIGLDYSFQVLSILASLTLSWMVIRQQRLLPRGLWIIPVGFVAFALCYVGSFTILARAFG